METAPKPDTKGKAALIIAAMSPKNGPIGDEKEAGDEDQVAAKEDSAQGMMAAMKDNDPKAFAASLEDFLALCDY